MDFLWAADALIFAAGCGCLAWAYRHRRRQTLPPLAPVPPPRRLAAPYVRSVVVDGYTHPSPGVARVFADVRDVSALGGR